MKTLQQLRADTGLPIDMLLTLLNEQQLPYNQEEVETWRSNETREGENLGEGKPSLITLKEGLQQVVPMESLYSLTQEVYLSKIIDYGELPMKSSLSSSSSSLSSSSKGAEGKRGFVVVSPCPFFPSQAGQEGDRGRIVINGESVEVINTVRDVENRYHR